MEREPYYWTERWISIVLFLIISFSWLFPVPKLIVLIGVCIVIVTFILIKKRLLNRKQFADENDIIDSDNNSKED